MSQNMSFGQLIEDSINKFQDVIFNSVDVNKDMQNRGNYIKLLKEWLLEIVIKNYRIKCKLQSECSSRPRQRVYWVQFGVNIGSEFSFSHFGLVIKEFNNTAIVVPISTEKEDDPDWKNIGNLVVPIGVLEDLPYGKKPCYAMVGQIRAISKTRLSDYYDKQNNKYVKITLNEDQMKKVLDAIRSLGEQQIKVKNTNLNDDT